MSSGKAGDIFNDGLAGNEPQHEDAIESRSDGVLDPPIGSLDICQPLPASGARISPTKGTQLQKPVNPSGFERDPVSAMEVVGTVSGYSSVFDISGTTREPISLPRYSDRSSNTEASVELDRDNPQGAFDFARRSVVKSLQEAENRIGDIRKIGVSFSRDAVKTALFMPVLLNLSCDDAVSGSTSGNEDSTPPRLVDAGGMAGGSKAVHEGRGLFLKTPDDSHGIYGSDVMAAKVMKLEAKATRWIHSMDSLHVSAPLCTVVDVAYRREPVGAGDGGAAGSGREPVGAGDGGAAGSGREPVGAGDGGAAGGGGGKHGGDYYPKSWLPSRAVGVQRVMVQARVQVGLDTLRVGSHDGGTTMHQDPEQEEDVVGPLAARFHIGPIQQARTEVVVRHAYQSPRGSVLSPTGGATACESQSESYPPAPDAGDHSELEEKVPAQSVDWLDSLRSEGVELPSVVLGQRETGVAPPPAPGDGSYSIIESIEASGASFSTTVSLHPPVHSECRCSVAGGSGPTVTHALPFDVEVHQLASGSRIVLDTHRLLMPDLRWIRWMQKSKSAAPRIWAVPRNGKPAGDGILRAQIVGQLKWDANLATWYRAIQPTRPVDGSALSVSAVATPRTLPAVAQAVNVWARKQDALGLDGDPGYPIVASQHQGAGLVVLRWHRPGTDAKAELQFPLFIVSCPRWYFGQQPYLTCMMPPEAAAVAKEHLSDDGKPLSLVSPDCVMTQGYDPDGVSRKNLLQVTAELCSIERLIEAGGALEEVAACIDGQKLPIERLIEAGGALEEVAPCIDGQKLPKGHDTEDSISLGTDTSRLHDLRQQAKLALHGLGFGLRHMGLIIPLMDTENPQVARLAWSACLPSPGSVTGAALAAALSACCRYQAEEIDVLGIALLQARAFACRGAVLELATQNDVYAASTVLQEFLLGCSGVTSGSCRYTAPVGLHEASKQSAVEHDAEGSVVWSRSRRALSQMLRELAHVQRVGGTGERTLLQQAANVANLGSEFLPLACRCLLRLGAMFSHQKQRTSDPAKYIEDLCGIGDVMLHLGYQQDGLSLLMYAESQSSRCFPDGDPCGVGAIHSVAVALFSNQKFDEALSKFQKVSEILSAAGERGEEKYLCCILSMATCLQELQRSPEAIPLYTEAREGLAKLKGRASTQYLATSNNVAMCLKSMGREEEGLQLLLECRDIQAKVLGKDHHHYLGTMNNLAGILLSLNRPHEAVAISMEALPQYLVAFTPRHKHYLEAVSTTASVLESVGRYAEAIELFHKCEACREQNPDLNFSLYYQAMWKLATCYIREKRFAEAESMFARVLPSSGLATAELKVARPLSALMLKRAETLVAACSFKEAAVTFDRVIGEMSEVFGPAHILTLNSTIAAAMAFVKSARSTEAVCYCRRARLGWLEHVRFRDGDSRDPDERIKFLTVCIETAFALHAHGYVDECIQMYETILEPLRELKGETSGEYLVALNNLGMALRALGRPADGLEAMARCLAVQERHLGADHVDCHLSRFYMATMHSKLGHNAEAVRLYEVSHEGLRRRNGPLHQHTLEVEQDMSQFYTHRGEHEKAYSILMLMLRAVEKLGGADHFNWARLNFDLAKACRATGKLHEAIQAVERAMQGRGTREAAIALMEYRMVLLRDMSASILGGMSDESAEKGSKDIPAAGAGAEQASTSSPIERDRTTSFSQFPFRTPQIASKIDVAKLRIALLAKSDSLGKTTATRPLALQPLEIEALDEGLHWLGKRMEAGWQAEASTRLPDGLATIVFKKLLRWPPTQLAPALDLARVVLLDPRGLEEALRSPTQATGGRPSSMAVMKVAMDAASAGGSSTGLKVVAARTLLNCCQDPEGVRALLQGPGDGGDMFSRLLDVVVPALVGLASAKPVAGELLAGVLRNVSIGVYKLMQLSPDALAGDRGNFEDRAVTLATHLGNSVIGMAGQLERSISTTGKVGTSACAAPAQVLRLVRQLDARLCALGTLCVGIEGALAAALTTEGLQDALTGLQGNCSGTVGQKSPAEVSLESTVTELLDAVYEA